MNTTKRFCSLLLSALLLLVPFAQLYAQDTPGTIKYPVAPDTLDSLIRASNRTNSTLNGAIENVVTTLTLADASAFPASGTISISSEIIYYTGKSGNQLTGLIRAREGTSAASHSSGVNVSLAVTARYHNVLADSLIAVQTKYPGSLSGILSSSGTSPVVARTLTGTTNQVNIANGDGISGNPTFSLPQSIHTGASPTFAGLTAAIFDKGGQVFNVLAYGADPTGVLNSQPAIAAAIAAAVAAGKGIVYFPPGTYRIDSSIIVGDGTLTTISTYAGIQLIGAGGTRLSNVTPASAVKIQWNGAANGIMVDVRGPIGGFKIAGIYLEADGTNDAGTCIKIKHAQEGIVENVSGWHFTQYGLDIDSWGTHEFNITPGPSEFTYSFGDGGTVKSSSFISTTAGSTGLRLGAGGTLANWGFYDTTFSLSGSGTAAVELRHTDHCAFTNVLGTGETGIRVKPISGQAAFPMNTHFYGGSFNGAHATTTANGAISAGATSIALTDASAFPTAGVAQIEGGLETFSWTGKSTNTLTGVTKGIYDTIDLAHASGVSISVAMDVVIDTSISAWTPTSGYAGLFFSPFNTADGAKFPTSTKVRGVTDTGRSYGLNQLSIGTPLSRLLNVSGQEDLLHLTASNGNIGLFLMDTYGSGTTPAMSGRRANGTLASPSAVLSGDTLFTFGVRGYHSGGGFTTTNSSSITFIASENWVGSSPSTSTETGSAITFNTTTIDTSTRSERMRILDSGRILIGTTSDNTADLLQVAGGLSISGTIKAGSGPTTLTDAAGKILSAALNTVQPAQGGTGITSLGTGVATWLGTPSSANFASAVTGETGTGGVVFDQSPTIVTPTIASFANASHNHTNSAGGGQLTISAFSSTTGSGAVVGATSPTLVTPTLGAATHTSLTGANLYGGTAAGSTLTIRGTSHATPAAAHIALNSIIVNTDSPGTVFIGGTVSSTSLTGGSNADVLHMQAPDGKIGLFVFDSYANGGGVTSGIAFRSAGGTAASPSATAINASLASFGGRPHDGTNFSTSNQAAIQFKTAEATTASAMGTYITLETTLIGTTSRTERWRVEHGGWFVGKELSANPTTTELAAGDQMAFYRKADKAIIAYNNGGTMTYLVFDLTVGTGTGKTYEVTTSAP